jgi:hypothetical protein
MDQLIPHLVVQCGKNHVTPVCKGLLSILKGKESALFLPRYDAYKTQTPEQIKRHFEVHQTWSRSLKPIPLAPKISHLDQQRVEYYDNGTIVKRSTREWALSLTTENDQPAHCDVVNGGPDRKATLVCPETFLPQAKIEWREYRSRRNPPSHREARFFDSISGIPDLSNIRTTNVFFHEQLSAAEIWKRAPPSVRDSQQSNGKSPNQQKQRTHRPRPSSADRTKDGAELSINTINSEEESVTTNGNTTQDASDARSTTSTAASTSAISLDTNSRFKKLERMIQNAQKRSDTEGKTSAAQLSSIHTHFQSWKTRCHRYRRHRSN